MLKKLFSTILLTLSTLSILQAQELNCNVRVMHDAIQNVDKELFVQMEKAITEFLNTRKWTNDQFNPNEKIECNVLLNVTEPLSGVQNGFKATLNIQASRPVYNTSYNSPIVNYIDRDVIFSYSQFAPLQYDDNRVAGTNAFASNLTAILAYYSYLIIGLDYDSFKPNGGSEYLKKAQNVVNNAPEQGKSIRGWKAVEGNRNRYWILDQLLNPRFKALRAYWYNMHRVGLDNMYKKPEESRMVILQGINTLSQLQRENPGAVLLQFFFNAKSDEIASVVAQIPKDQRGLYITMLQQVDVPNAQKYNSLKK
ncbi:MAG: DUF4835 family protein [Flavipsychrobacter sp.]